MPSGSRLKGNAKPFDNIGFGNKKTSKTKAPVIEENLYDSISINLIVTDKNIRTDYNEESINELAESIKSCGLLEPLRVYSENNQYVVIFGHRRLLACKKADKKFVECIICAKPEPVDILYIQLIENEQKENLSASDLEKCVKMLKEKFKLSVKDISAKIGKSEKWIYQIINAQYIRDKYQDKFDNAGIHLTTRDTTKLANAKHDDVMKAIEMSVEKPGSKTKILDDLAKSNRKRPAKPKEKENKSFFKKADEINNNSQVQDFGQNEPVIKIV